VRSSGGANYVEIRAEQISAMAAAWDAVINK